MVFDAHTMNDNEQNLWTSIGLQAALIVNKLRCQAQLTETNKQQNEQRKHDGEANAGDEKQRDEHRAYVEELIRQIERFERKSSGIDGPRRKRNY